MIRPTTTSSSNATNTTRHYHTFAVALDSARRTTKTEVCSNFPLFSMPMATIITLTIGNNFLHSSTTTDATLFTNCLTSFAPCSSCCINCCSHLINNYSNHYYPSYHTPILYPIYPYHHYLTRETIIEICISISISKSCYSTCCSNTCLSSPTILLRNNTFLKSSKSYCNNDGCKAIDATYNNYCIIMNSYKSTHSSDTTII